MVRRKKNEEKQMPDAIDGICESANVEQSDYTPNGQYHLIIKPTTAIGIDFVKDSKTKRFHNYIKVSEKTTPEEIAEDSVLDKFIQEVEVVLPKTKQIKTHVEVINVLVGKKFRWIQKRLGRSFEGKEGRSYWVPIAEL